MKNSDSYTYPVIFTYLENGQISVTFPDLRVATQGENDADALKMARECMRLVLNGLEEDGEEIPKPTSLLEIETSEWQRTTLVDVDMSSVRMCLNNRLVQRTVTLPAWLNTMAEEKNIDLSLVLQKVLMEKLGIEEEPVITQ